MIAVIGAVVVILTLAIVTLALVALFDRKSEAVAEKRRRDLEGNGQERKGRMFGGA